MGRLLIFCLALAGCATLPSERAQSPVYAWAAFDRTGIVASGASGLADRGRGRRLTIDDPVRIASLSKLVVALGAMRMVEEGRLDLDHDVSDYLRWPLRNPAYPAQPITLRLLLSHRSSLTDGVDYAIPLGIDIAVTLANPAAFDPAHAPGAFFHYANINFPVVATIMEKVAGERFDRLMKRLVLDPLKLDACYNWASCGDGAMGRAVVLYAADGSVLRDDLGRQRPACPVVAAADGSCDLGSYRPGGNGALFSPQGGLRISVRDLAKVGRLLLDRGVANGSRFLTEASIAAMIAPQWRFDGTNGDTEAGFYCSYGLAVQLLPVAAPGCADDLFGDGQSAFGHAGDAYGVRSGLWIDPKRAAGIAYFAVDQGDDPPKGRSAYRAVEEMLAGKLPRRPSERQDRLQRR